MKRPTTVPADAYWDAADREWVSGPVVDGQKDGPFRYWRADGTPCAETTWQQGTPTGAYRRFHENGEVSQQGTLDGGQLDGVIRWHRSTGPTTENTITPTCAPSVWTTEQAWRRGALLHTHYFDRAGREVTEGGTLVPTRPAGVDARALYNDMALEPPFGPGMWFYGHHAWVMQSLVPPKQRVGEWKYWSLEGRLVSTITYVRGRISVTEEYDAQGALRWRGEDVDDQDDEGQALSWKEQWPDGSPKSEGIFANRPKASWTFWPEPGAAPIRVAATKLDKYFVTRDRLHEIALACSRPLEPSLLAHPALFGLDAPPWSEMICAYPKYAKYVPHYLRGLVSADPWVRKANLGALFEQFVESGGYSASAAAMPFLIRVIAEPHSDRDAILRLLIGFAGGELSHVRARTQSLARHASGEDEGEDAGGTWGYDWTTSESSAWDGPDYNDFWQRNESVIRAIEDAAEIWISIMNDPASALSSRCRAAQLVAVGNKPQRASRMRALLAQPALPPEVRGELLLGLVLVVDSESAKELLDPAREPTPLGKFCAALTHVRVLRERASEAAVKVLLDATRNPAVYAAYDALGWSLVGVRDPDLAKAYADATAALGLLGERVALLPVDDRPHRYPYRLARSRSREGGLHPIRFAFPWTGHGVVLRQDAESAELFVTNEDASRTLDGATIYLVGAPEALRLYERFFVVVNPRRRKAGLYFRDRFEAVVDLANGEVFSRLASEDWDPELEAGLHSLAQ